MAELEFGNRDNLFNVAQAYGADDGLKAMAQNLVEVNPLVKFLPSYPSSDGMSHSDSRWDALPEGTFISLGDAPTASKGTISKYKEVLGYLASRYQIPEDILEAKGTATQQARYRWLQERASMEGMTQGLANALIRGTAATAPEKLDGILNRAPWNAVANTEFVFDVGGTTNLRHAIMVKPGEDTIHLLHPKNRGVGGIERIDRAKVPVTVTTTDVNGTTNAVRFDYMTDFKWFVGWNIKNQKAVKIIGNIDITYANITETLIRKVIEAANIHTVISSMPGAVNPDEAVETPWHLFVDPNTYIQFVTLAVYKGNVQYNAENPYRVNLHHIDNIMIHKMDALNYAASQIV